MGRKKNDGKGRLGGRQPGTPNKVSGHVKDWVNELLNKNRQQIEDDLQAMLPQERVKALFGLIGYIIPKQQAISVEEQTQIEADALAVWLQNAPAEAIDGIAAKIMELQEKREMEDAE